MFYIVLLNKVHINTPSETMSSTNVAAESLASNPLDKKPEEHFRDWPNEAGVSPSSI